MEDLFGPLSSDEEEPIQQLDRHELMRFKLSYEINAFTLADGRVSLRIRESNFHPLNANFVWPGNEKFSRWIIDESNWNSYFKGKRILELGAGLGVLSIFVKLYGGRSVDILTSDYSDPEIADNIRFNCELNGIQPLEHIPHNWGSPFPTHKLSKVSCQCESIWIHKIPSFESSCLQHIENEDSSEEGICQVKEEPLRFDTILANDVIHYVSQHENLVHTLVQLLQRNASTNASCCIISWGRKISKSHEQNFLELVKKAGCNVEHLLGKIYRISLPCLLDN